MIVKNVVFLEFDCFSHKDYLEVAVHSARASQDDLPSMALLPLH